MYRLLLVFFYLARLVFREEKSLRVASCAKASSLMFYAGLRVQIVLIRANTLFFLRSSIHHQCMPADHTP